MDRREFVLLGLFVPGCAMASPLDLSAGSSAGEEPAGLLPVVGAWVVQQDGPDKVVAVDGSHWKQGSASPRIDDLAAAAFPADAKPFASAVKRAASFPLAIVMDVPGFSNGTITVRFKPLAGHEDQAAGIAFAMQPSGDYFILRANALEDNLVLFQFRNGRRSALEEVRRVPTRTAQWHTLQLSVSGKTVEGKVDGKQYLRFELKEPISGRVGLWSKADSTVQFRDLEVRASR
jgi:hypothetical protein